MRKLRSAFLSFPVILAAIIIAVGVASQVALADARGEPPQVIILADRTALAGSEGGVDLAQSFVGLISTLRTGQSFQYVTVDQSQKWLGPAISGEPTFEAFRSYANTSLMSSSIAEDGDLVRALAAAYNRFTDDRAAMGSTVYVLTAGTGRPDISSVGQRAGSITRLFKDNSWTISMISLSETSSEASGILSEIASATGGDFFEVSVAGDFRAISEAVLQEKAAGLINGAKLGPNEMLVSTLSIAPGTNKSTLMVFRQSPQGSFTLTSPDGSEPASDGPNSATVIEAPHFVVFELTSPAPGPWRLSSSGVEGSVSAWHFGGSQYDIAILSFGTMPLNQSAPLVAYVTNRGAKVDDVSGVRILATILTPDGTGLVYSLNDDGVSGDAVAGDGYFATEIPQIASVGQYDVELELLWPQFGHKITSSATLRAENFPEMEITPIQTRYLKAGERSKVATIFLHVAGEPYAIPANELTFSIVSNSESAGEVELKPQRILTGGRAWQYDVLFTPAGDSLDTLTFHLDVNYADRQYSVTASSMVLSSVPPVPAYQSPAPAAAPQPAPVEIEIAPRSPDVVQEAGFPWELTAVAVTIVSIITVALIFLRTRTSPFGYLYDERNQRVVDFRNLKRHPLMGLLFKGAVPGKELRIPGLEGVWFKFAGSRVGLASRRVAPTVRVNNQPLITDVNIQDHTRIGTHGRLFQFLINPPAGPVLEPLAGDD